MHTFTNMKGEMFVENVDLWISVVPTPYFIQSVKYNPMVLQKSHEERMADD